MKAKEQTAFDPDAEEPPKEGESIKEESDADAEKDKADDEKKK